MRGQIVMTIVLVSVAGAGGFWGGINYQQNKQSTFRQAGGLRPTGGQFLRAGDRQGSRAVVGEIINRDDKSITVKSSDGSSKIVFLAEKTEVSKTDQAEAEDLKVGERVAVFGSLNSDGSVTAQNIQLDPTLRGDGPTPP